MDINLLPMELLQEILSYLCYETLKVSSLVCHRWNQASEKFILRNGLFRLHDPAADHLDVIRNCVRSYQTIRIHRMDEWSNLQAVTTECVRRFPSVRKLHLAGCLQDYLYRFYDAHRSWVEQCESFRVSLDDRFTDHLVCGPEDFELILPNLKHLHWAECLYGNGRKKVTITAPNLECVYIDDSLDASAVVRIPICDRLKFIRCMLYTKHFDDTFVGNLSNVETLIMDVVYGNCDTSYLPGMHQLRYLRLCFGSAKNSLQNVEAMQHCQQLKFLSITIQDCYSEHGILKLEKVFNNFINLETLDLRAVELRDCSSIQAKHLKLLKLRDVTCSSSVLSLHLPRLEILSISANILSLFQLRESDHLKELYLDLESSSLKHSLEHIAIPFILSHKNLKKLILLRSNYQANRTEDNALYDFKDLGVEHLELHQIEISIDFFRMLSQWKSLKSLTIVACSINCRAGKGTKGTPRDTIRLPEVQRMTLDCVKLRGTSRTDFPLLIGGPCELRYVSVSSTLLFSTQPQLDGHHRRFNPFEWEEIDPLH